VELKSFYIIKDVYHSKDHCGDHPYHFVIARQEPAHNFLQLRGMNSLRNMKDRIKNMIRNPYLIIQFTSSGINTRTNTNNQMQRKKMSSLREGLMRLRN